MRTWSRNLFRPDLWAVPGYPGIKWGTITRYLWLDLTDTYFWLRASAMAYSFFFAIFPTLLLGFSLIPYIPIDNLEAEFEKWIKSYIPDEAYDMVESTVHGVFTRQGIGLISITFLILIFSATRGIVTMIQSFQKMDTNHFIKRNFWQENLLALYIFFVLFLLTGSGLTILIGGEILLNYLHKNWQILGKIEYFLYLLLNWAINFLILLFSISFIYNTAPALKQRFRFFSLGGLIASVFVFIAQIGLRYYFSHFTSYNKLYGSLAAVMILMVWIYWNSFILLLGFEINVSADRAYHEKIKNQILK
jgi:membrane protein